MVEKRPHPTYWPAGARKLVRLIAALRGRPRRVVVSGASMLPAFGPGDRLVVVPVAGSRLETGRVVAVGDPREPSRLLIKRIVALSGGFVDVRGDNDSASTDSRHFGSLPRAQIVGEAVYRYHPPDRAGWLSE